LPFSNIAKKADFLVCVLNISGISFNGDRLEIVLIAVSLSGIADAQRFLTSFWSKSMSFLAYLVP
jgi:hypothetical protein